MAEAIVFRIAERILTGLGSLAVQEIGSALGVRKDLKRLETILSTVKAVLTDAEEQQLNNHEIREWLRRIKDASYDADDIFDDFEIEALRQNIRIQRHGSPTKKVLRFTFSLCSASFRFRMSRRIKEVRRKFEEIAEDRSKFHLTEKPIVDMSVLNADRQQTHSFVDEAQVFGREGDKDKIIKLLLETEQQQNVSVFAIQGMGGLGKTTLAQMVYNDTRVSEHFDSKMWVCVAQRFDVKEITHKILASATNSEGPNFEMDQLQAHLRKQLQGKIFLLVLDDVWNQNEESWDKLKSLLTGGAKGSKILITTRSEKVASIMGAGAATYCLRSLSDDDCWQLFKQRAFARGQEKANPNLVVIGKKIVKKCGGVPLAAKSLGSLMRFTTEEREWASVKDNDIWKLPHTENNILPALRLSYNHLPFALKQCFAYCFFMRKGYTVLRDKLIQMWIAQGFIVHPSGDYQCLHDIGEGYINELSWRSFFQINNDQVTMHDLIHDLARDVAAGTECYIWEKEALVPSSQEVRHVTFADFNVWIPHEYLVSLCGLSNLRTLDFWPPSLVYNFFSHFRCLRVLIVNLGSGGCPSSIGKLKHLRYLSIASRDIQTLPKSFTKLLCLESLTLDCPELIELPSDIEKLVNLRYIYLDKDAPLSHMSSGLRNLTSLRELTLFVVGKGIGCKLRDLHGLIHLGGFLKITNLENLSSAIESAEANLRQKQIRGLQLLWNKEDSIHGQVIGNEAHVAVLETLQPHQNTENLMISGYGGTKFPPWLMEPMFPKIETISLFGCEKCLHLPPFWKLPSLKNLLLENMDALESIESGDERGKQVWFPSLRKLTVKGVPNLESMTPRVLAENNGIEELKEDLVSFPSLEKLVIFNCSEKLTSSLLQLSSSLSNSSLAKLRYLKIEDCDDLEALPEGALQRLASLEKLKLACCWNLVLNLNSSSTEYFTSLKVLRLEWLPMLVSLPEWIQNAAKLQQLSVFWCEGLMSLPDWMGNLTSLRRLSIGGSPQLKYLPDTMQQLTALKSLMTVRCNGLTSWPNWLGSFASLDYIHISCSSNIPSLPKQLQTLTCLQILTIDTNNVLESLPEWMVNLSWLQELVLENCGDHLISRCQTDTGIDWRKISHIPKIEVNDIIIQGK